MASHFSKTRLTLGLLSGLAFLTLLAGVALRSADGFAKSGHDVQAVHDSIELVDQTQDLLTGADSLQHQILLGNIKPDKFNLGVEDKRFTGRIASLSVATAMFPSAHAHVERLALLGKYKLMETSGVVKIFALKGRNAALNETHPAESLQLISEIGKELGILRQFLLQRLKTVASDSDKTQKEAQLLLQAGLALVAMIAVIASLSAARDAGRRRDVEDSLRSISALQRSVLDSAASSIIATDAKGTITEFNRNSETMLGYSASELVGLATPAIFHVPEEVVARAKRLSEELGRKVDPGFELFVRHAMAGNSVTEEWTFVRKDGSKFPAALTVSQIVDDRGVILGYVGVSTDLTEQTKTQSTIDAYVSEIEVAHQLEQQQNRELKRSAEELKETRDSAVAATRMKSEFLANMSHEIRTPMNGVIGMTHLLLSTPLTEKQLGYARTVQTSAESLLTILNDILDLSKMEAGKMTLENFPFDLRLTMEDLCDVLAPLAHEKQLEMNCVFPPSAPSKVIGDPGRLRQVLTNLIGNAIKFTERGEVSVSIRVLKENQKRVNFLFNVADTGIGISADRQEKIFDSFTQADGSTTRRFGGTGLGLTISRQLTELMGGEIGVKSTPGAGSEFWIEMAFQKQTPAGQELSSHRQDLEGIRVLVADDNATNRFILREMLGSWNCRLEEASSGAEALSALSLSASDPFACVVMDMHMPGMDGLQAAKIIKLDPRHRDLPLILLSSSGFAPDDLEAASLFAAILSKPVRTSPLFNALSVVSGIHAVSEATTTEFEMTADVPLKGVKVLVVEDNAVNQLVVTELLRSWGCVVVAADNGAIGVEATNREKFDVILMDVQMPVMDGFEATAAMRAQEEISHNHTDIIAMTANAMSGDRERCLRAGMDSYLSKPLQPALLLEKLAKSAGRHVVGTSVEKPTIISNESSFDPVRLDESCSGSISLKLRVIERYLATSLESLAQISQAIASGDANSAKSAAHALKGSSLTIGSTRVGDMCQEIEIVAASPKFGPEKLPLAQALSSELRVVHGELKLFAEKLSQAQE